MVVRLQKSLVVLATSSRHQAMVKPYYPSLPILLGRPAPDNPNYGYVAQTNTKSSQSVTRRGISKAARRRNSKRYATFFHPPYLATPEYSQAGHDLVHSFAHYTLFNSVDEVNEWAQQARHDLQLSDRDDTNSSATFTSYWHPSTRQSNGIRYAKSPLLVGLDVGWNFHMNTRMRAPTHTLHVSLPLLPSNHDNLDQPLQLDASPTTKTTTATHTAPLVASLHLTGDGLQVHDANDFPHELRRLLQHASLLLCGLKINRDLARLARKMDVHVDQRVELDIWAKELQVASKTLVEETKQDANHHEANINIDNNNESGFDSTNTHINLLYRSNPLVPKVIDMAHLCRHFLTPPVEIEPTIGQDADYTPTTNNPHNQSLTIPQWLVQYGAVEAWHSRLLAEAMYQRRTSLLGDSSVSLDKPSTESRTFTSLDIDLESPPQTRKKRSPQQEWEHQLHIGQVVEVYFDGNLPVGLGVVEFIGGRDGIARRWGNLIVNRGKVLVRITRVDQPRAVPTFNAHTAHLHLAPGQPLPWDGKVRLQDVYFSTLPLVACPTMNLKRPNEVSAISPEQVKTAATASASASKLANVSVVSSPTKGKRRR